MKKSIWQYILNLLKVIFFFYKQCTTRLVVESKVVLRITSIQNIILFIGMLLYQISISIMCIPRSRHLWIVEA